MDGLQGKSGVVVGGGSGIGRGIALGLAAAGMRVVVGDIDGETAKSVAAEIIASGGTALARQVDGTDRESLAALAQQAVDAHGGVHVLSSNVGVVLDRPLADASDQDWGWVIECNLLTHVRAVDVFLPQLRESAPAHVVMTASLAGLLVVSSTALPVHLGLYTATKHAVVGYGLTLRAELAPEHIGVSVLCPGIVQSNLGVTSARHRPARHGGPLPVVAPANPIPGAMPAEDVGPIVVSGILGNRAHILTHPGTLPMIDQRNDALSDDFRFFAELAD